MTSRIWPRDVRIPKIVLMFVFDNLHPLTTDALTTDSGKWLDVYRLDDVHKV